MKLMTNQVQKLGTMFIEFGIIEQIGRSKHKLFPPNPREQRGDATNRMDE